MRLRMVLLVVLVLAGVACSEAGGVAPTTTAEAIETTSTDSTVPETTTSTAAVTTSIESTTTTVNPYVEPLVGTWRLAVADGEAYEATFDTRGTLIFQNTLPDAPLFSGSWEIEEGVFTLHMNTTGWSCAEDTATYEWALEGDTLQLTRISDDCWPRHRSFETAMVRQP